MRPILSEDDLKREIQGARCREALRLVGVPEHVLKQLDSGPILFQFAHMAVFLEQPWRSALNWINDHKGEILAYAAGVIDEYGNKRINEDAASTAKADRAIDGIDVGAAREGQSLCVGDDGIPMGGKKDSSGGT